MGRIMALAVGMSLVLAGCEGTADWAGEWKGHREVVAPPGSDETVKESLSVVRLKILPSGEFELMEESFDKGGSATLGPRKGHLTVKTMLGRPVQALGDEGVKAAGERVLTMNKDGTITMERPGFDAVILKRVE